MLIRFLTIAAVALMLSGPAKAQDADIEAVIANQLDAFKADDFARAFTFASPNIKRIFGSAERFGQMVRNGYPMVWRPADVQFIGQEPSGASVLQTLRIEDGEGAMHFLEYEMIPTDQGWQINGVRFIPAPDLAV